MWLWKDLVGDSRENQLAHSFETCALSQVLPVHGTYRARRRDVEGGAGDKRGRTLVVLALVIRPLTTHPFRDGEPV